MMGVDWRAKAIIGCRIPLHKLSKTEQVRGCGCPYLQRSDVNFCPQCGAPAQKTETSPIEEWDEDNKTLFGYMYDDHGSNSIWAFFGPYIVSTESNRAGGDGSHCVKHPDAPGDAVTCARHWCRNKLKPVGLWDEKEFGLWAMLYASY